MGLFDTVKKIVAGDVAHDAADSGNPIKIGGKAATSAPSAVSNGDRVNAWFDANGRLMVAFDQALDQASWPSSETPLSKLAAIQGVAASAVPIWIPVSGSYIDVKDIQFSTDTQLSAWLHQATEAEYISQITADGAVHLYACNESSGDLTDSIGALTAVAVGSGHTYQADSLVSADGDAVGLNGSSQAFSAASAPVSCTIGALECWMWLDAITGTAMCAFGSADEGGANDHFWIGISSTGKPNFNLKTGGANRLVASCNVAITPRRWHHVVWQHDGTGLECYLDGELQNITYSSGNSSTAYWYDDLAAIADNLAIGVLKRSTSGSWWQGRLTMLAWYDANKSADVWRNHYALGASVWGPHYFAAYTGAAVPLRAPLRTETGAGLYLSTSASANATMQISGIEVPV